MIISVQSKQAKIIYMCRITTAILNISIEMVTELADQTEK